MGILIGLAVAIMIAGGIFYNKLRVKYYGIIGVGGSYMALIGIMMLVSLIGTLFGGDGFNSAELVVGIIFMIIGLGYLVYVMIARCNTVMQRVFLPLAAAMIAFGFCGRFMLMLIFKVPMSSGASETTAFQFPATVHDNLGETWELQHSDSEKAEYRCRKNGDRTTIWCTGGYLNIPSGWREN